MRKLPRHDFGSLRVKPPLVFAGQRVGLMGGSFNPPHQGHVVAAEAALKRLKLDQLWWVVTPGNPLKTLNGLPALDARMALVRRYASGPKMKVTGFEADLGTPYTAATLAFLKRRYPGVRFVWVMGADNLATFNRWQHWREIAAAMPMAIVDRPGYRLRSLAKPAAQWLAPRRLPEASAARLARARPPAWTLLTTRLSPLSSTALRRSGPLQHRE